MGFVEYILWGGIALVVGTPIGVLSAKVASAYLKRKDRRKILKVMAGKIPNSLKLDGELIEVDTFKYKKSDGKIVKVKLEDLAKQ